MKVGELSAYGSGELFVVLSYGVAARWSEQWKALPVLGLALEIRHLSPGVGRFVSIVFSPSHIFIAPFGQCRAGTCVFRILRRWEVAGLQLYLLVLGLPAAMSLKVFCDLTYLVPYLTAVVFYNVLTFSSTECSRLRSSHSTRCIVRVRSSDYVSLAALGRDSRRRQLICSSTPDQEKEYNTQTSLRSQGCACAWYGQQVNPPRLGSYDGYL